jgi:hypothetical protein
MGEATIITVSMVMLLEEAFKFYMLFCGNSAVKQKTVHSSMTYYVQYMYFYTTQEKIWLRINASQCQ